MNECGEIWQNLAYMQVTKTNRQNKKWMNAGKFDKIWPTCKWQKQIHRIKNEWMRENLTKFGLHASNKNK